MPEGIDLKPIAREDIEIVWKMQVEAFSDLSWIKY